MGQIINDGAAHKVGWCFLDKNADHRQQQDAFQTAGWCRKYGSAERKKGSIDSKVNSNAYSKAGRGSLNQADTCSISFKYATEVQIW